MTGFDDFESAALTLSSITKRKLLPCSLVPKIVEYKSSFCRCLRIDDFARQSTDCGCNHVLNLVRTLLNGVFTVRVLQLHTTAEMKAMTLAVLFLLFIPLLFVFCAPSVSHDPCDPKNQLDPRMLRWDKITVLINGYSEYRIPLLQSIAATYSASPLVSSVLVLWGNPSTSSQTLSQLAQNLSLASFGTASISVVRQSSSSLNSRFIPRSSIQTHAVVICDDDVEIDTKSFEFAFRVWQSNPDRLIGVFVRSHDIDLMNREWIYTVHPDKYSIVLTKFMILENSYLFKYSCGGGVDLRETRRIVDEMNNCEDILMNFVVADEINKGPIMVGAERVRDWGDARNDDHKDSNGRRQLRSRISWVGLSSRRREHRKRRGICIREFHRVWGRMPLSYSYGKVVNSVGEQGLCRKAGKLVLCDQ